MDISQETLKEFCSYDQVTGQFVRIKAMNWRHKSKVGKPCGTINIANGYVTFHVGRVPQYAHRLAWIYVHGSIPSGFYIDHVNGVRSDNRIENLRLAGHLDNLRNCKTRTDNTSGVKGVSYDRTRNRWMVTVGKRKLGRFATLEEAAAVRKVAAERAFGEFARE